MNCNTLLFFCGICLFLGCNDKMKKTTEPAPTVENVEHSPVETPQKAEILTHEKIAELANEGTLSEIFSDSEIKTETASINEGMDHVKVVWLRKGSKNEVRIDVAPNDSTKVFRVTAAGKENKYYSETGVKPGMTVDGLNSINRKPIVFYGFQWDFGGAVKFNN